MLIATADRNAEQVRLFKFEGQLGEDLKDYKARTGNPDSVLLSVEFPADYPSKAPFM